VVLSNIFFLSTNWKTNQGLGFAFFVEMSVEAREEAAKFELNGSKWMGNQYKFMKLTLKKNHSKTGESQCLGILSSKQI